MVGELYDGDGEMGVKFRRGEGWGARSASIWTAEDIVILV